jgi:hypothetical protein
MTTKEEVKNDLESKMADLLVTIDIHYDAFDRLSNGLGKKGMHRVLCAGILYPEPPKIRLQNETELECYSLLQDIMNAKFSVSLINMALRDIEHTMPEEDIQETEPTQEV